MTPEIPAESPSSPQELQQAFALFNHVSEQLTSAYADLQINAERLTQELAVANGELRRQYEEKEALSQRLVHLLAALPGGVVVVDVAGVVEEVNPAALKLLGEPLVGDSWQSVCSRTLSPTSAPGEWLLAGGERRVSVSSSAREGAGGEILLLQDVTDAHAMGEQLQRHKRLSAMGEMAAALAHQLRTPLAAALLYTSIWEMLGSERKIARDFPTRRWVVSGIWKTSSRICWYSCAAGAACRKPSRSPVCWPRFSRG